MKKFLLITFLFLFSATIFIACHNKEDENGIPELLEHKKDMGAPQEAADIRSNYQKAVENLKNNPDDTKQYLTLATVFIQEGRLTGNGSYYSNAAMKMINKAKELGQNNKDFMFEAYSLESTVLLNMHQFKDALTAAQKGVALFDFNSAIYGALVDANVELGNYDTAVKDCDKMISIRPDLRSYSRASYLRQIYGQNAAAVDAMKMAVEAGAPGLEGTEWARVGYGNLYLNMGKLDTAAAIYQFSLQYRPGYPPANIGMARVAEAKKQYDTAISYTKKAIEVQSEAAYVSYLGDLYALKGDADKAKDIRAQVIDQLAKGKEEEASDAPVKHNVNREMAMAYLAEGKNDDALKYAQNDLNMRPNNIDANELIAWIYYLKGDNNNARMHADKMLATHTQNANTLYKAGVIYAAAGDAADGTKFAQQAIAISPYIDPLLVMQTKNPVNAGNALK